MQPQNPNNFWQPGDQPAPSVPPTPIGPAAQPAPAQPPVAPSQPIPAPQQSVAPSPQPQQPQPVAPALPPVAPVAPILQPAQTELPAAPVPQPQSQEFTEPEPDDFSETVTWQAKEFIHQEKNGLWFAIFSVVLIALMAAAILLMKSWSFAILLVVIAAVIIVFSKRPPRVMNYSLSTKGLSIGETLHPFKDFKAFGVIHDGAEYSIMLIPTKRFMPGITVYFPEELGEEIVDILGSRMPMQELHLDMLDRIIRKIRL